MMYPRKSDPLCQLRLAVCDLTNLSSSRKNFSIEIGKAAHTRSFLLRFGECAQVAPGPLSVCPGRRVAEKDVDHLWRIHLDGISWIAKCRRDC